MRDWKKYYEEHIVTAEEAISQIRDGEMIVPAHAASEPQYLFDKLVEMKERFTPKGVGVLQGLNQGPAQYATPDCYPYIRIHSFFYGKNNRAQLQSGRGETIPMHFYAQPVAMREGYVPVDVGFMQCTPPDENGMVNMGLSCDQAKVIINKARITICQVNKNMPWVEGDQCVPVEDIDYFVLHDEDLIEIPFIKSDDPVSEAIGENIASLIEDGSCLQMGQGNVPNAILKFLENKHDLGIHTEVFSDNLIPLVKKGVINGSKKNIDQGKIVATFIQGTKELYKFVDHNPIIKLMPVDYTNSVGNIGKIDKMVAINSATAVDLMGQVVADSIGSKMFSGVGGQQDFIRGAEESRDGKPINALPATAKHGTVSRINAVLPVGTPITTTRNDVHFVVTEYGIADLFGKPINERARQLINIAAPEFRKGLFEEFVKYQKSNGQELTLADYLEFYGYDEEWAK